MQQPQLLAAGPIKVALSGVVFGQGQGDERCGVAGWSSATCTCITLERFDWHSSVPVTADLHYTSWAQAGVWYQPSQSKSTTRHGVGAVTPASGKSPLSHMVYDDRELNVGVVNNHVSEFHKRYLDRPPHPHPDTHTHTSIPTWSC